VSPNARDRARAKRRYVKRQAKLAQRKQARRNRQQITAAVLGVVLVIGGVFAIAKLTSSPAKKKSAAPASTPAPTATSGARCPTVQPETVAKPEQFKAAPPKSLAAGHAWIATVDTSCGPMTFDLDGQHAPQTVASFIFLARKGFFNKTTCHRLTTTGLYVLQCGDPTGTGSGGPGYGFGIENAPKGGDYPAGTIAMARATSPTSNGSQFFIVYKDSQLPTTGGGYTIFGTLVNGQDVVTKVAGAGVAAGSSTPGDGAPATPINITSVSVK
jgi:peptidyl-prolyl cis-trans isomerase B (cyclophilin B)